MWQDFHGHNKTSILFRPLTEHILRLMVAKDNFDLAYMVKFGMAHFTRYRQRDVQDIVNSQAPANDPIDYPEMEPILAVLLGENNRTKQLAVNQTVLGVMDAAQRLVIFWCAWACAFHSEL